jgi:hypothetical protein
MNNPSRRSFFGVTTGGLAVLAGCSPTRGTAVPIEQTRHATVLGVPNERFFPFYGTDPLEAEFQAAGVRLRASQGLAPNAQLGQIRLLSVSGGGENGAFGAGLLCGWSDHGTRPVFELVTGISTGALTAPFAYLGSSYDPQRRLALLTPSCGGQESSDSANAASTGSSATSAHRHCKLIPFTRSRSTTQLYAGG